MRRRANTIKKALEVIVSVLMDDKQPGIASAGGS
jgi:hypothetical protein